MKIITKRVSNIVLFLFVLFVLVSFVSPPLTESQFIVHGNAIQSSYYGDLYNFDVHVFGMENISVTSVDVYLQIVLPEGGIKLYQLDYLRHKEKQEYISYSCELCLTEIGRYQSMYFVTDQYGNKTFDPYIYEFAVFSNANSVVPELK